MRRFAVILSILTSILGLCGYYLGHRLLSGSELLAAHPTAVWSGVFIFLGLVLLGPMLSRILPPKLSGRFYALRWSINMTMAVFFAVLFYTFVTDLAVFLFGFFLSVETAAALQSWSLLFILVLVIATLVIGAIQALSPRVYRVDVPLKGLPPEFEGFRIAQISDLHIGEMIGHRYVQAVVEKTNSLLPDLIALTGDIIDGTPQVTRQVAADLAALKATDGTLYVTGNHEYYWGVENALTAMKNAGARVLLNENIRVHRGANEIVIAGVTDISAGGSVPGHKSDPQQSVAGVASDKIKILLAHQPVSYRQALKAGFDLQLSGHTHGGQFFPWSLVVRLFQHYNKGLIRHENLWIYVNRGTATWGPRLRFGIPPEITLLTLRNES
jgi:uncharacterized protein